MPEGRQSPPPERQSGKQQQAPPGSGQGTDNAANKGQEVKKEVEVSIENPSLVLRDDC